MKRLVWAFGLFVLNISAAWAEEAADALPSVVWDDTTFTPPDRLWGNLNRLITPAVLAAEGYLNTSSTALTLPDGRHLIISFWLKERIFSRDTRRCVTWHTADFVEQRAGCASRLSSMAEN